MNRIIKLSLILMCMLTGKLYAQQDTNTVMYIEPKVVPADLTVYQAPQGFVVGQGFNGYYHPLTQITVVMTMIENLNYINMKRSMTDEYFVSNMMTKTDEFEITCVNGLKGIGYQCEFVLNDKKMIRQLVFIGDMNRTLWLSVTFPAENLEMVNATMRSSYQTVQF